MPRRASLTRSAACSGRFAHVVVVAHEREVAAVTLTGAGLAARLAVAPAAVIGANFFLVAAQAEAAAVARSGAAGLVRAAARRADFADAREVGAQAALPRAFAASAAGQTADLALARVVIVASQPRQAALSGGVATRLVRLTALGLALRARTFSDARAAVRALAIGAAGVAVGRAASDARAGTEALAGEAALAGAQASILTVAAAALTGAALAHVVFVGADVTVADTLVADATAAVVADVAETAGLTGGTAVRRHGFGAARARSAASRCLAARTAAAGRFSAARRLSACGRFPTARRLSARFGARVTGARLAAGTGGTVARRFVAVAAGSDQQHAHQDPAGSVPQRFQRDP